MEDLLQKQVHHSCKLALPEGLQDLMSDISREVLRAQPQNLLQYITDHLAALLVARENLFVAARVCDDVCKTSCYPELEDELREVGLTEEDVEKTVEVVTDFFESGGVKETNLLLKLLKKTEIDETQLPAVIEAVRSAFLRHQVNNTAIYESSSTDSDMDESLIAAKHTIKMYRKTKEPGDNYNNVVEKIQAAYRAYNVRRKSQRQSREKAASASPSKKKTNTDDKTLHFENKKVELLFQETPRSKRCSSKASSVSLAGSFVPLPSYKPYSIDEIFSDVDEVSEKEKEHTSVDYTQHWNSAPAWNQEARNEQKDTSMKKKNISFHDLPQIMNKDTKEDDEEIPEEIEEADEEFDQVDEELIQEQMIKNHIMSPYYSTKAMVDKNEAKNKNFSDIIQKVLDNDQLICTKTINENYTKSMEENTEALNQDSKDILYKKLRNKEVPPLPTIKKPATKQQEENTQDLNGDYDGIVDEEFQFETYINETNIARVVTAPNDKNNEQRIGNDSDIIGEELTYEPITEQMVKEEAMQTRDSTELIAKKYEAQNIDGDENVIVELINEPVIVDSIVDEELIWYGDGCDLMKEDSECESRDGDNIVDFFGKESAAASFTDLA
ncbi:hypothetical protein MSG28_012463 [Choristoneura fumiferana]|uniref:Uncharacterized protein n=1 Tax=Choristoneura fumiferana TaxID=7141 RepID=A0ACC0KD97_CHOFU|nr:hypothetical protein MSG28_012463 [Choristoneura fumiferana]